MCQNKSLEFFKKFSQNQKLKNKIQEFISPNFKSVFSIPINDQQICYQALDSGIKLPFQNLLDRPSKFVRPLLVEINSKILNIENEETLNIQALIECLHNVTLIIDDIQDKSDIRRGKPAIHKIYGVDTAINTSLFYLFYLSQVFTKSLKNQDINYIQEINQCTNNFLLDIYLGVTMDVEWHKNQELGNFPTFEQFFTMLHLKTSRLIQYSVELLKIMNKEIKEEDFKAIYESSKYFGIAFQINDDIINIVDEDYFQSKGLADDFHEQKLSYLILDFMLNEKIDTSQKEKFLKIFKKQEKSNEEIYDLIQQLKKSGVIERGVEQIEKFQTLSLQSLQNNFDKSNEGLKLMTDLHQKMFKNELMIKYKQLI